MMIPEMDGIDTVLHMAGLRITPSADNPPEGPEVMWDGSFNLVEAAQSVQVKKVVASRRCDPDWIRRGQTITSALRKACAAPIPGMSASSHSDLRS